jgi:malonyl-CoA/methylmalonyl-CoA synthetase
MDANLYSQFLFERKEKPLLLLDDDRQLTYEAVDKKAAQYCHFFVKAGLKPGDKVIQQTEKSPDALCVYLAALRSGLIYIPLNLAFQADEVAYFVDDAAPALFICSPNKERMVARIIAQSTHQVAIETLSQDGNGSIQEKTSALKTSFETVERCQSDIACILYTSGTTGKPKGAMLSHKNLLVNAQALKNIWGFSENDTLLHMLPIFHCHGLFFACHSVMLSGASMIFLPKFDVDLAIKHLPNSTVLMGVPTYYTRLLSDVRFTRSLAQDTRLFISGSAPLLEKTFYAFEKKIGQRILERYGMTETGINTSNALKGDRIPGTVGLPLPLSSMRIVDDHDRVVESLKIGHIQVSGENVFCGYWRKEAQNKQSFTSDGFFRTGDLGQQAESGYISIVGRAKDIVITGGLNVYPKEVESVINKLEGIKESAVVGVPHPDFGEAVIAVVIEKEGVSLRAQDVILKLKQNIADYKVPKHVLFIKSLPRNAMGKVQKNTLRDTCKHLF